MTVKRKQTTMDDNDLYMEDAIGSIGGEQTDNRKRMEEYYDDGEEQPSEEQIIRQRRREELGVGSSLRHVPGAEKAELEADMAETRKKKHLTAIGGTIAKSAEIRDGWMDVDKRLLGERANFYPEDWQFRIRPATVDAIRNWSTIDDENWSSIDDVFNEILKSCLAIRTDDGPKPWNMINSWDRFFFILLIREYTFVHGEKQIKFQSVCPNCDVDIDFTLTSTSLGYDMPDAEVMPYYDAQTRTWNIDPTEFDVETDIDKVTLYLPNLEKEANFKNWLMTKVRDNRNYKPDASFMRFVVWLCPKISKDPVIAKQQIKQAEMQFKSWDADMFSFMDEVLKNITVTPATHLKMNCPACGEEVTAPIEFQDGIRALFAVSGRHKKFGKK